MASLNSEHKLRLHTVVGAGFIALDIVKGPSVSYRALGGSAGNVVAILSYLGWRGLPVGFLGADSASLQISEEFNALGAETDFLRREQATSTPIVYQTIEDGRPKYSQSCPVCGKRRQRDNIDPTWLIYAVKKHIQKPVVYYFDRANSFNAILAEHIRSLNGVVIFEPSSVVDDEVFRRCLKTSHVVKYAKDRIESLQEDNAKCDFVEIQTLGAEGLRFKMPRSLRWAFMPSIPTPFVADSSGSGDWCTAGAVHWFAEHSLRPSRHNIRVALRFGQALASMNCMYEGARNMSTHAAAAELLAVAKRLSDSSEESDALSSLPALACLIDSDQMGLKAQLCCEQFLM